MSEKLKILIVEDEIFIGMLIEKTLENLGYEVCAIVSTEADAVFQAQRHQPDLMIVDAGLRIGSGITAVETITAKHAVPHIFVTGDRRKVLLHRPDAIILEKPFFNPDLVDAISRALDRATAN